VNREDLANEQAPTVLVAAESHQRLFTSEVASQRNLFTAGMSGADAYENLKRIYDGLYGDGVLLGLSQIADIINSAVKHNLR